MEMNLMMQDQQVMLAALRNGNLISERSKEYWGEQEDEELRRDFESGKGISEICLKLQRSENAVIQRLSSMHLLTPPTQKRHHQRKRPKCLCPRCLENACPMYDRKEGTCGVGAVR